MKFATLLLLSITALNAQIKDYTTFVTETFPPAAAATASYEDYDDDGILNIVEFAFGTDATVMNAPTPFQLDILPSDIDMDVLRSPAVEAKLTLQFTPNLSAPWQDQESGKEFTASKEDVSPEAGKDAYTLTLPKANAGFYRFVITLGNTDFDEDGVLDDFDMDDDNDGVRDHLDAFPNDATRFSNATPIDWTANAIAYSSTIGQQTTVSLPPIGSVPNGTIWGTDIYTNDSSIGRAAVHAGILTTAGGEVTVEYIGNHSPFVASTQNGITSYSYGNYPGYKFVNLDPDTDGDGQKDSVDLDDDNDGVPDTSDAFPLDENESADSDSDGVGDNADAFPNDSSETNDNDADGTGDNADPDDDNDGVLDGDDPLPFNPNVTTGTLISWSTTGSGFSNNYGDIQTLALPATDSPSGTVWGTDTYWYFSNIGAAAVHAGVTTTAGGAIYFRALQSAPASSGTTRNGISTAGFVGNQAGFEFVDPSLDSDEDTVPDYLDAFPDDPTETVDSDSDGVGDNADAFPADPAESADFDEDGTGDNADLDDDNDSVPDAEDAFPFDATESLDSDGDGIGNNADTDDDNDGVLDGSDAFPLDPNESVDSDSDGVGDNADAFPNDANEQVDTDGDGIGNNADTDDDGDGILDTFDNDPLLDVLGILASSPTWQFPLPYGTTTDEMASIGSVTLSRSGLYLARSTDGGNVWQGSTIENAGGLLFSDGSSTFYIIDGSELLTSTDGLTFTTETVPNGPWTAGAHDQSGRLMLARLDGINLVIRFRDNGGAWTEQSFFSNWGSNLRQPDKLLLANDQFVAYGDAKGTIGTYNSGTGLYSVVSAARNFSNASTQRGTRVIWDGAQFYAYVTTVNNSFRVSPPTEPTGNWVSQPGSGPAFTDLIFNGSTYAITGYSPTSSVSSDGINWTTQNHGLPLRQVVWDGNRFIASGEDAIFATSPTGEQWTQSTSGVTITNDFHFVVPDQSSGSNTFQFGGSEGILMSMDDQTITTTPFSQKPTSTTETIYDAFFRDGGGNQQDITIAVGTNGLIRETKNPFQTFSVVPPLTTETLRAVSLTTAPFPSVPPSEALIVGDNGTVIIGLPVSGGNGFTWALSSINNITSDLNGIGVDGQIRTVVGDGGVIVSSTNHGSWSTNNSGTSADLLDSNGAIAVGRGGAIVENQFSGNNWAPRTSGTTADLHGLHAHRFSSSNTTTVIVGDGVILTSINDLSSWQVIPIPNAQFRDVFFDQTLFIAVGLDGVFYTSTDGLDWDLVGRLGKIPTTAVSTIFKGNIVTIGGDFNSPTSVVGGTLGDPYRILTSQISGTLSDLDDNGEVLVASGESAWYSTDGLTWTDTGVQIECATWDGSRFVGVGPNTTIYASPDGITWKRLNTPAFQQFPDDPADIIYAEGLYILASGSGVNPATKLRYSTDAVTWTNATILNDASTGSTQLRTVAHNGTSFVASRVGFYSFTSDDGITWTRQNSTVNGVAGFYVGDDIDNLGTHFVTSTHSSTDGIDWTPINGGRGNGFGNGTSVTVVGDQLLITNQDGVTLLESD